MCRPSTCALHLPCLLSVQSLQKHMAALRQENRMLKNILTERLGESSKQVIYDCTTELSRQVVAGSIGTNGEEDEDLEGAAAGEAGAGDGGEGGGKGAPRRDLSRPDYRLVKSLQTVRR